MSDKKSIDIRHKKDAKQFNLDEIEGNLKIKEPFDWRGAALTLILIIIAIWSAYFVTLLISGKPLPDVLKKAGQAAKNSVKTSTTKQNSTLTKKQGAPALPDGTTAQKTEDKTTENPFKPLDSEDVKKLESTKDTAPAQEIAKNSFKIRILNGNGISGDAAKAKDELAKLGYNIGTIGNANLKYTQSIIYYIDGSKAQAELLAKDFGKDEKLEQAGADLIGEGYQILLVLGTQ